MLVRAADAALGRFYKVSRSAIGPSIFYSFLDQKQVRRLVRRLERRRAANLLTADEQVVLNRGRDVEDGGGRIAVRHIRGVAGGQKYEHEQYAYIPGDYKLREITRPLGFVRRQQITG